MKNNWMKAIALAVVCVMIGAGVGLTSQHASATEATTERVVVTSPFTQAIADVKGSVVGVRNYQQVRYSNGSNNWVSPSEATDTVTVMITATAATASSLPPRKCSRAQAPVL